MLIHVVVFARWVLLFLLAFVRRTRHRHVGRDRYCAASILTRSLAIDVVFGVWALRRYRR
ncbi:MAG: hypothetical protein HY239_07820 [Mycolicibacterium aromaticivorans]|nr:hypothetical protein [Mycolicibacterium aromaticivorans]